MAARRNRNNKATEVTEAPVQTENETIAEVTEAPVQTENETIAEVTEAPVQTENETIAEVTEVPTTKRRPRLPKNVQLTPEEAAALSAKLDELMTVLGYETGTGLPDAISKTIRVEGTEEEVKQKASDYFLTLRSYYASSASYCCPRKSGYAICIKATKLKA